MLKILALAALLLLASLPTHAAILFVGGEDVDFQLIGTVQTSLSSTFYRSGYARLAQNVSFNSVSDPPANRLVSPVFANQSTIWIHAETYQGTNNTTNLGMNPVSIYATDGLPHLMIRGTGTGGQVKISKETAAGVYTDLATCTSGAWPAASLHKFDWFTHYNSSGETTLYIDGTQVCDFIGDVTTDSLTAVNQVTFAGVNIAIADNDYWSEVILSTTDTRNMNLVTLAPVANGANMAWSGTVANVNGTNYNDTNPLTTGTANLVAEFTTGTLPAGSFTIPVICQSARVEIGTSGPQNFSYIVRPGTGSTDYSVNTTAPTTAFANYQNCLTQDPSISAGWTPAALSGIQYGVESQP